MTSLIAPLRQKSYRLTQVEVRCEGDFLCLNEVSERGVVHTFDQDGHAHHCQIALDAQEEADLLALLLARREAKGS